MGLQSGCVSATGGTDKDSFVYKGYLNFFRGSEPTVGKDPGLEPQSQEAVEMARDREK